MSPSPPSSLSSLGIPPSQFAAWRGPLLTHVRASFPRLCSGRVEDAVGNAYLAAYENPLGLDRAYRRDPGIGLAWMKVVAWRAARNSCARHGFRKEFGTEHLESISAAPPSEVPLGRLKNHLDRLLDEAVATSGGADREAIRDALVDRLGTGDADTAVAERHPATVRREYLNRARRSFERKARALLPQ